MPTPILYESHMHTPLCRHATGTPAEYAAVAHARHLKGIIVTCHNPMPDGYSQGARMYPHQWPEYLELVRATAADSPPVEIRLGLECDFAPGFQAFLEKQIASAPFEHVLGSVHPQIGEYRTRYFTGDPVAYQRLYFQHLAQAAETRLFDTLSHPDLVKNVFPNDWQLPRILDDIRRALDRIAKTNTAMELNTSGLNKEIKEMNPAPEILQEIALRHIPIVLGADAHTPDRVGDHYPQALTLLEQAGHTHIHLHLHRTRLAIPIPQARASLT